MDWGDSYENILVISKPYLGAGYSHNPWLVIQL
jgi:hypothetical protein